VVLRRAAEIGQEIVAMTHGLDVEEDAVEGEGDEAHEAQLGGGVERPGHARRVGRQDQGERSERHQHDEIGAGARQAEALLAIAQAAQDQAEPDHTVADDHDHREDGLAREAGRALAGQHDREDQGDLDHGHRDGQHEGAVGLAGAVRDHVGVIDGGEHDGHQDDQAHQRQRRLECRRHLPRDCRKAQRHDEADERRHPPKNSFAPARHRSPQSARVPATI
jgi:hypothetical protein